MTDPRRTIEAVFRLESARLIAGVARLVRDVGIAEELAQDAMVAALEQWPRDGIPERPGAWLMAAARHRAFNVLKRGQMLDRKHAALAAEPAEAPPDLTAMLDDDIGDDLLRLVFTACHPVLGIEARVALTLRLVGGLTVAEIARAFLTTEPTIAQRIVRAKRALAEAEVGFEAPRADELPARLSAVLGVVYLIFNEGYAATAGDDWMRPALCEDAMRLGRTLATLVPDEPEVHGLLALMELQASRLPARTAPDGAVVLLEDQDRSRWDRLLIHRGLAGLARAESLAAVRGAYTLQAALAACHARAVRFPDTDWRAIVALYDELARRFPSPVISLNRAVAIAMADGPAAGLAQVDALAAVPALARYHRVAAVRADLLRRLDRAREAAAEYRRAATLTSNARERAFFESRAAECER